MQATDPSATDALQLTLALDGCRIKIEVSPVSRGTVWPTEMREVVATVEESLGYSENRFLSFNDVYAGASRSVLAMTHGLHDFSDLSPTRERKQLENDLRSQYDEYFNEDRGEWDADPVYTAEEANREANPHHRYRLFTFSNFLTTLDMVSKFQDTIEEILADAHAGSVLLMIGATGGCYPTIRERVAKLAEVGRFRHHHGISAQAGADETFEQRLREEIRSFYHRLKRLAVDLPANGPVGAKLQSELENHRPMTFNSSTVLAFRK